MALRNQHVHSLVDVVSGKNPDGSSAHIAEILEKSNPLMTDVGFVVGNLDTGNRHTVRASNAKPTWVGPNQGILPTKGTKRQVDEKAGTMQSKNSVARDLAIKSGNPAEYRTSEGRPHIAGMADEFGSAIIYANAATNENQFTGLFPRFNDLGNQVISAGGTGTRLRSIALVGWAPDTVTGIVSKEGHSGLQHFDTTSNLSIAEDSYPVGDEIDDGSGTGATYLGYSDRWSWEVGLAVKDDRYVVRGANLDMDALALTGGLDIEDFLIQMLGRFGHGEWENKVNAAFYMPRDIHTWLWRQEAAAKKSHLSWGEIGGRRVLTFQGVPLRQLDAMNVNEQRVT